MKSFDAIVIGGGSGGLAFAKRAARNGARVLLIERQALGGTCVNRGCVPKKLLWDAAWHRSQHAAFGHDTAAFDLGRFQKAIRDKIGSIRDSFADNLDAAGVTRLFANAEVEKDGRMVRAGGEAYAADHVVIATGASPTALKIDGSDMAQTSDDVLSWTDVPDSIVFLGGGYIGCELASIFAAFGSDVSVVDPGDRLLTQFDKGIAGVVADIFGERGIALHLGAEPVSIRGTDGDLTVRLDSGAVLSAARVVAAVGRTPNIATLGPLAGALEVADSGALSVTDRFETSVRGVHAIGDAADRLPLTPVATRDGEALADMLFGSDPVSAIDLSLVASAAFVMPPIAQVGDTDDADMAQGADLASGALCHDRHWTMRTARKIATDGGRVTGAALMAASAADMIAPFAVGVAAGSDDPHRAATGVHPTFGEETVGR